MQALCSAALASVVVGEGQDGIAVAMKREEMKRTESQLGQKQQAMTDSIMYCSVIVIFCLFVTEYLAIKIF